MGKRLIEAGFAWVRGNGPAGNDANAEATNSGNPVVKLVALEVKPQQTNARALYGGMGFQEVEGGLVGDCGGIWMVASVERQG